MPTRADVLAIRSIEDAFDITTTKIRRAEVALIRTAEAEGLLEYTNHAAAAAGDASMSKALGRSGSTSSV